MTSDMPHPIKHCSPLGAAFNAAEDRLKQVLRAPCAIKELDLKRVGR